MKNSFSLNMFIYYYFFCKLFFLNQTRASFTFSKWVWNFSFLKLLFFCALVGFLIKSFSIKVVMNFWKLGYFWKPSCASTPWERCYKVACRSLGSRILQFCSRWKFRKWLRPSGCTRDSPTPVQPTARSTATPTTFVFRR